MVKNLASREFDEFISKGVSVIDFHADWCAPCRIVSSAIEEISKEMKNVKFGKVDVDKEGKLAQRFEIFSIPTILFFKNKELVDRIVGAYPKNEIEKRINKIK